MGPLLPSNYIISLSTIPFYLTLASIITLGIIFSACSSSQTMTLEEEAQSIDKLLMCPFCPAETIDQAQVPQAKEMQAFVRERLAQGWTKQEILDYFSSPERYGPRVLAEPPKSGPTLAVWLLPPAGFSSGRNTGVLHNQSHDEALPHTILRTGTRGSRAWTHT